MWVHFNSQPHKEADVSIVFFFLASVISTHSLTRRLTILKNSDSSGAKISTHSLTRRLTESGVALYGWITISTHSLTRRLTAYPPLYI